MRSCSKCNIDHRRNFIFMTIATHVPTANVPFIHIYRRGTQVQHLLVFCIFPNRLSVLNNQRSDATRWVHTQTHAREHTETRTFCLT